MSVARVPERVVPDGLHADLLAERSERAVPFREATEVGKSRTSAPGPDRRRACVGSRISRTRAQRRTAPPRFGRRPMRFFTSPRRPDEVRDLRSALPRGLRARTPPPSVRRSRSPSLRRHRIRSSREIAFGFPRDLDRLVVAVKSCTVGRAACTTDELRLWHTNLCADRGLGHRFSARNPRVRVGPLRERNLVSIHGRHPSFQR